MAVMCQNVIQTNSKMGNKTTVHILKWVYLPHSLMLSHHPLLHKFKITKVHLLR